MNRERPRADSVFVAKSQKGYLAREALFDAAVELIAEEGINGTTVSKLCAKAGMQRTSFYNYFNTMEEMLDELSVREDKKFDETLVNHFRDEHGIRRLALNILGFFEITRSEETWNRFAMEMFAHHEPTATHMTEDVRRDLLAAIDAGDINVAENDIDALAYLIFASLLVANTRRKTAPPGQDLGRQFLTMILNAANTKKSVIRQIVETAPDT